MLYEFATREDIEDNSQKGLNEDGSVRVLDSFDLFVDPADESVVTCLIRDGYWEAWITSWFTTVVQPHWVCLDIGANFGYYTGVLNKLAPNGQVIAFEPNPVIGDMLEKSKQKNGWENVDIHKVALGETSGTGVLTMNQHLQGSASLLMGEEYFQDWGDDIVEVTVPVETLDSFGLRPDFVKMDIEGFEPAAFEGGSETLAHAKVIVIEATATHPPEFFDMLFENYNVMLINDQGHEEYTSRDKMTLYGWMMLALRRK